MTLEALLSTIAALAGLTFVVGSMLAMGLSLTTAQILGPLSHAPGLAFQWAGYPAQEACLKKEN
jgi:hypothetical protein